MSPWATACPSLHKNKTILDFFPELENARFVWLSRAVYPPPQSDFHELRSCLQSSLDKVTARYSPSLLVPSGQVTVGKRLACPSACLGRTKPTIFQCFEGTRPAGWGDGLQADVHRCSFVGGGMEHLQARKRVACGIVNSVFRSPGADACHGSLALKRIRISFFP